MRVSAFYSPFFVNCTQVQIFQTGVKKLKITVEYDFSSFLYKLCTALVRDVSYFYPP